MIFLTGDTHGASSFGPGSVDGFIERLKKENFPIGHGLTKHDYVIIIGDFGGIWRTNRRQFKESQQEAHDLDWLDQQPFTTLFLPGNHENYDRLTGCIDETLLSSWLYKDMPESEKEKLRHGYPKYSWHGGIVRKIRPSVFMLEDGIFSIDGQTFLIYGGADSYDIKDGIMYPPDYQTEIDFQKAYDHMFGQFRVQGISWWKQEQTNTVRETQIKEKLKKVKWKVDHVLTHSCPKEDAICMGYKDASATEDFLQELNNKLQYTDWYFGHFHQNKDFAWNHHRLLYEDIVMLPER